MAGVIVLKAGGDLATREAWRAHVASSVAAHRAEGRAVVLVHGGGPQLDQALQDDGVEVTRVAGRRITAPEVLDRAIRIWRGELSLQWVEALRQAGVPAVGLCGVDGELLAARKRPPVAIDGEWVDFGRVGDIEQVRPAMLHALFSAGMVPVISPLAADRSGGALNVNADTVAAHLAVALGAEQLVLLTRSPGILADPAQPSTTIPSASLGQLAAMEADGSLHSGMRPKLAAIRHALEGGVARAHVREGMGQRGTLVFA